MLERRKGRMRNTRVVLGMVVRSIPGRERERQEEEEEEEAGTEPINQET